MNTHHENNGSSSNSALQTGEVSLIENGQMRNSVQITSDFGMAFVEIALGLYASPDPIIEVVSGAGEGILGAVLTLMTIFQEKNRGSTTEVNNLSRQQREKFLSAIQNRFTLECYSQIGLGVIDVMAAAATQDLPLAIVGAVKVGVGRFELALNERRQKQLVQMQRYAVQEDQRE